MLLLMIASKQSIMRMIPGRSELRASNPSSRGHARWLTERAWAAMHAEHGLPVHIFRLGGKPLVGF